MNKSFIFFITLLLVTNSMVAMGFLENFFDDHLGSDYSEQEEENRPFDHFYCDVKITASCNDSKKNYKIAFPLLVNCCLQAAQTTGDQAEAFEQLLDKIENNNINISNSPIHLTEKDIRNRILSCIPYNGNQCLVRGKKIRLGFMSYETYQDKKINEPRKQAEQERPQEIAFPDYSEGRSYTGIDLQKMIFSEQEITCNYNFGDDKDYNQARQEFSALLAATRKRHAFALQKERIRAYTSAHIYLQNTAYLLSLQRK